MEAEARDIFRNALREREKPSGGLGTEMARYVPAASDSKREKKSLRFTTSATWQIPALRIMIVLDTNVISEFMGLDSCSFCYHDSNGGKMAQLLVRNLDDRLKRRLQRRAKRHGRSMEAEAREILRNALREDKAAKRLDLARLLLLSSVGSGIYLDEPIAELHDIRLQIPDFES